MDHLKNKLLFLFMIAGALYFYTSTRSPFGSIELSLKSSSSLSSNSNSKKSMELSSVTTSKTNSSDRSTITNFRDRSSNQKNHLSRSPSQTLSNENLSKEELLKKLLKKWDTSHDWVIEKIGDDIKSFSLGSISTRSDPHKKNSEIENAYFIHSLIENLSEPLGVFPENLGETHYLSESSHQDQQVYETEQFYQNIPVYGAFSRAFLNPNTDTIDQINSEFKNVKEPVASGPLNANEEELGPIIFSSHPNNVFKIDWSDKWAPKKVVYVDSKTSRSEVAWLITVSLYPEGDSTYNHQMDRRQMIIGTDTKRVLANISFVRN